MAAGTPPRKRAPAKKAPAKRAPAKQAAGAAPQQAAPAPAAPAREPSLNEWLHDVNATPRRVEAFDRWWEFKQPTGGRAVAWDRLLATEGIRAALASMMLDETRAPEIRIPGKDGAAETVIESPPGSARADEFIAIANEWVPPEAAEEFWRRMEDAVFGVGEVSAS